MQTCYAILIDGGFAKRKLGTSQNPATSESFRQLVDAIKNIPELTGSRLHRVYYYDSVPLESSEKNPLSGELLEFGKQPIVARSRQLFAQMSKLPLFAIRLGELSFNGWLTPEKKLRRSPEPQVTISAVDLKPHITQKGVDMRIGMDIAALTLKKHAQIIVLVTGDSDFVPAMKFARREGAQLFLAPLGHRIKESMYEHSDRVLEIDMTFTVSAAEAEQAIATASASAAAEAG